MKEINQEILKDAQYRKGLSIAFFNATNNALELVKAESKEALNQEQLKEKVSYWRDWLLTEHKNYYATVINNVGANYDIVKTLEKINTTKDIASLKKVFINLSADEKNNPEVLSLIKKLKKDYETIQRD